MSLLACIRGEGPADENHPAASMRRLCTALLAENRLEPGALVAARIEVPPSMEFPAEGLRACGWKGIPIFWAHGPEARFRLTAHVRLKRRRRLRAVALSPDQSP